MNVAILGYGTVGSGVYEIISKSADKIKKKTDRALDVKRILDIREFPDHERPEIFTKNYDDIISDSSIDIVVETMGGVEPAYTFTKKALECGKNVVTSNKELVAKKGTELLALAKEKNVNYLFEASVGGGIPVIRPLHKCLAANDIDRIYGILNGTTNYILTRMIENGKTFEDALSEAQANGYAEKDPTADVEGHDAARKTAILASLAFGNAIDSDALLCEGITNITLDCVNAASDMGYVIKLIGYTEKKDKKVMCRVSPMLIKKGHPMSAVSGVFNAIMIHGDYIGDVMFYGQGAGKLATASAILGDVIDIANESANKNFIWRMGDNDFVSDAKDASVSYFVLIEGGSEENIKSVFADADIKKCKDNALCFITPSGKESTLDELILKCGGKIAGKIRVLN